MEHFKSKFKNFQHVVVLNFMANGTRQDINALVLENGEFMRHEGQCLLSMCGTQVMLPEDKLVDAQVYWDAKRAEEAKKLGEGK